MDRVGIAVLSSPQDHHPVAAQLSCRVVQLPVPPPVLPAAASSATLAAIADARQPEACFDAGYYAQQNGLQPGPAGMAVDAGLLFQHFVYVGQCFGYAWRLTCHHHPGGSGAAAASTPGPGGWACSALTCFFSTGLVGLQTEGALPGSEC